MLVVGDGGLLPFDARHDAVEVRVSGRLPGRRLVMAVAGRRGGARNRGRVALEGKLGAVVRLSTLVLGRSEADGATARLGGEAAEAGAAEADGGPPWPGTIGSPVRDGSKLDDASPAAKSPSCERPDRAVRGFQVIWRLAPGHPQRRAESRRGGRCAVVGHGRNRNAGSFERGHESLGPARAADRFGDGDRVASGRAPCSDCSIVCMPRRVPVCMYE